MVALFVPPPAPLAWVQVSRDLWRSVGSRFDLIDSRRGYWVAIDGDTGTTFRSLWRERCAQWCAERVKAVTA